MHSKAQPEAQNISPSAPFHIREQDRENIFLKKEQIKNLEFRKIASLLAYPLLLTT